MEGKKFIYSLIDCVQRLGLGIKDRREANKEKKLRVAHFGLSI